MDSRWRKVALCAQASLLIYFEVCMWLPLGAWNNQWSFPVQDSLVNSIGPVAIGFGTVLLFAATALRLIWLMWIGIVGHCLWFLAQAVSIWPPYIFGASETYARMYQRVWGHTTKLLPSWENHLAPDAMHVFIQALLLAVLTSTLLALLTKQQPQPAGRRPG